MGAQGVRTTTCPYCVTEITMGRPRKGARKTCPSCGAALEVSSVDPLQVDLAYDDYDAGEQRAWAPHPRSRWADW